MTPDLFRRPLLLYRGTCPKCRVLSRLLVLVSLHTIERMPIDAARAAELTRSNLSGRGKLTLIDHTGSATAWRVVPKALVCVLRAWFVALARK